VAVVTAPNIDPYLFIPLAASKTASGQKTPDMMLQITKDLHAGN